MSSSTVLQNIRSQPESLMGVLSHQTGAGKDALLRAAAMLSGAGRVVITGMGASLHASVVLEYALCSMGVDATSIESGESFHYKRKALRGVVVAVSRSGESAEVTKLLDARAGGLSVIGITNTPESTLAREADCTILVNSLPDEMIAIQSYTGTVLTLQLLAAAVAGQPAFDRGLLQGLPELIERCIEQRWDPFLKPGVPVYLLGRGYSMASAHEGALLFHETAKAPAVAMACAAFRHGPAEMVDNEFRGIVFAPNGPTRELNEMLTRDLQRFGGHVRLIGPQNISGLDCCFTPDVPDSLAPLWEVIPLQCAALRLAEMRGIPVGEFRYTPMVTRDETSFTI